jgi:hypothetical protein
VRWLAALALVPGVAPADDAYMRCHLSNDEPGAKTCYLPLVNAAYNCVVSEGQAACEDTQLRPIECRAEPGAVFCIPGARVLEPAGRFLITGDLPFTELPPKPVQRRRSIARTNAPERSIPTLEELMRGPPRPSAAEEAMMDAADAAAEAADNAARAAYENGRAIRAQAIEQREAREQAERAEQDRAINRNRGVSCYRSGSYLYCNPL